MGFEQKQQREILTSLNAISMSLWAFKFNKEWNRSDTLLEGIKNAQSEEGSAHKANDMRIPYHLSIKHLEDVISIFLFSLFFLPPTLRPLFFDNFSDFKRSDNVISSSSISFYFFTFFVARRAHFLSRLMSLFRLLVFCHRNENLLFLVGT